MAHNDRSESGTRHSFEVGEMLEKVDTSVWEVTNRMIDVDTDEVLYRMAEAVPGASTESEILTESQIRRSFEVED